MATIKKWKVDNLVMAGTKGDEMLEKHLNGLSRDKWDIYKIHFTKTQSGYEQVYIVSKRNIQKGTL